MKAPRKGAEDDAPRHEEQAYEGTCQASTLAPSASAAILGAQQGDEVVEPLDDNDQHEPHHQLRRTELYAVGKVEQQHAPIGQRRAG